MKRIAAVILLVCAPALAPPNFDTTVVVKSLVGPGHIEITVTARK